MANVPKILEEPIEEDTTKEPKVDPIKSSEKELKRKYPGLSPKAKNVAQRKISTGGTQYFDSGEYAIQGSRKGKQEIALHPKPVFNPALARLHGGGGRPILAPNGPQPRRGVPTSLATSSVAKVEQ